MWLFGRQNVLLTERDLVLGAPRCCTTHWSEGDEQGSLDRRNHHCYAGVPNWVSARLVSVATQLSQSDSTGWLSSVRIGDGGKAWQLLAGSDQAEHRAKRPSVRKSVVDFNCALPFDAIPQLVEDGFGQQEKVFRTGNHVILEHYQTARQCLAESLGDPVCDDMLMIVLTIASSSVTLLCCLKLRSSAQDQRKTNLCLRPIWWQQCFGSSDLSAFRRIQMAVWCFGYLRWRRRLVRVPWGDDIILRK